MDRRGSIWQAVLKTAANILILSYQMLMRGILPPSCRHIPSCSDYTRLAIGAYGFKEGVRLGWNRLKGCHPFVNLIYGTRRRNT